MIFSLVKKHMLFSYKAKVKNKIAFLAGVDMSKWN